MLRVFREDRVTMLEVLLEQLLALLPSLVAVVPEPAVQPQGQQVARILQEYGLQEGGGVTTGMVQHAILQAALSKHSSTVKTAHAETETI